MSAEEDKSDRSANYEHDLVSMGAASSITFHMGAGLDDATNRYLNLPDKVSYGTKIIPTTSVSISEINGRTLKVAEPVGTGGWSSKMKLSRVTLVTGAADVVSVEGKC